MLFPVCVLSDEGGKYGISPLAPELRFKADTTEDLFADVLAVSETMTLPVCDDAQKMINEHAPREQYAGGLWFCVSIGNGQDTQQVGEPYKLNVSMDTVLYARIRTAAKAAGMTGSAYVRDAVKTKLARG